jgi:hypothetical protein
METSVPIDVPKALLDAGGWVAAATIAIGVITGIIRGDLVPGNVYKREIMRADTATAQLERQNELGEKLTTQVETLTKLVADVLRGR